MLKDTVVKNVIRVAKYRAGFRCEKCNRPYLPADAQLHGSHFISRGSDPTRAIVDPENIDVLCAAEHTFLESFRKHEYRPWKRARMGTHRYRALLERSRAGGMSVDLEGVNQWCRDQLRFYESGLPGDAWLRVGTQERDRRLRDVARRSQMQMAHQKLVSWYDEERGVLVLHAPGSETTVILSDSSSWVLSPHENPRCSKRTIRQENVGYLSVEPREIVCPF